MVYFIECDAAGSIWHIQSNPFITIVPLINIANDVTTVDGPVTLVDPIGVTAATYTMILAGGINNYTYDFATETVIPKAPANVTAPTT